ncbi:MAG: TIGR02757 family protein [Planctomycetota bacterium]
MSFATRLLDYKPHLEALYNRYNHKSWVHPDPLEFLYAFGQIRDREIAGLIASALAYGRVAQILVSTASILDRMPFPYEFIMRNDKKRMLRTFGGFKHRFTTADDLVDFLLAVKKVLNQFGSIEACFASGLDRKAENIVPAMEKFVQALDLKREKGRFSLIPHPDRKSACKRTNLFLRWMVRKDNVDPGGWTAIDPSLLIIPLDTHMHRIALRLGLTERKQADLRCALEVTGSFREINPKDPTRYDFALTRLGIHPEGDMNQLLPLSD